jgi:hypothetical protein
MTQGHITRSAETWDAAKTAYLDGQSAAAVCERFHLNDSTFRTRARRQKWRRADQPDPEPHQEVPTEDLPLPDMEETFRIASARVTLAVRQNRIEEALRWGRIMNLALRDRDVRSRLEVRAAEVQRRIELKGAVSAMRGLHGAYSEYHQTVRAELDAREAAVEAREAAAAPPPPLHPLHCSHPVFVSGVGPTAEAPPTTRAERRRALREARKRR